MNQEPICSPDNPHPLSTIKTELVWDGKYDEVYDTVSFYTKGDTLTFNTVVVRHG